jgi:hypothetical protein
MKGYRAIMAVALSLVLPGGAFGLSCAPPRLDENTVNAAIVIFEGTAGPKRLLSPAEATAVGNLGVATKGGGTTDLRVYGFVVTRGWKGVTPGRTVDVLTNAYWGDNFAKGETYLVVSPQRVGTLFSSPLCGYSSNIKLAAELGNLATLKRLIGGGQN